MLPPLPRRSQDLTEFLSEVYDADRLANDPRTREFLEAGERLLCDALLRETGDHPDASGKPPFEEVFAWIVRSRVIKEAQRARKESDGEDADRAPTEAAFRYRWHRQAGYLRDLVIWALCPRMERPGQIRYASRIIDDAAIGGQLLPDAISEITAEEVRVLMDDHAFRLQMIIQATLAHDPRVADALCRIDKAHVEAWAEFARESYGKLGLTLRDDIDFEQLGCALHAAGEGVMFRAMLPARPHHAPPSSPDLLTLLAKALVIATADWGDGKTVDDLLIELVDKHRRAPD